MVGLPKTVERVERVFTRFMRREAKGAIETADLSALGPNREESGPLVAFEQAEEAPHRLAPPAQIRKPAPAAPARRSFVRRAGRISLVFAPTIVACFYFFLIAADRFESQARFIVKTAAKPSGGLGGLTALLQMTGLSRSQDDTYAVQSYMMSGMSLPTSPKA